MTIIANIGNYKLLLKDIKSAEILLNLFAESQPVERHYTTKGGYVFTEEGIPAELSISIENVVIVTRAQLQLLRDQDAERAQ